MEGRFPYMWAIVTYAVYHPYMYIHGKYMYYIRPNSCTTTDRWNGAKSLHVTLGHWGKGGE